MYRRLPLHWEQHFNFSVTLWMPAARNRELKITFTHTRVLSSINYQQMSIMGRLKSAISFIDELIIHDWHKQHLSEINDKQMKRRLLGTYAHCHYYIDYNQCWAGPVHEWCHIRDTHNPYDIRPSTNDVKIELQGNKVPGYNWVFFLSFSNFLKAYTHKHTDATNRI